MYTRCALPMGVVHGDGVSFRSARTLVVYLAPLSSYRLVQKKKNEDKFSREIFRASPFFPPSFARRIFTLLDVVLAQLFS